MTTPFMKLPPLLPNTHWENVAPLGEKPIWKVVPGEVLTVDLNDDRLFGIRADLFMMRQHKGK